MAASERRTTMDNQSTPTMTVREVAEFFKLTPCTIYKLVNSKKLPSIRIGCSIRFERQLIVALAKGGIF